MKTSDIENIINQVIIGEIDCKAILIDGSWGCGKTTAVNNAISRIKSRKDKNKIIYQSLFGTRNIDELSKCYYEGLDIAIKATGLFTAPFFRLIPYVGDNICEGISNATNVVHIPSKKKKKNKIIIFDDLERVDKDFSYTSLLGLFNQLILNGCKIICISSLTDLRRSAKKDSDIMIFVEKAFDRIIYINESPNDAIISVFKDKVDFAKVAEQCASMFESNIRIAIKTNELLSNLIRGESIYKYSLSKKYNKTQILKAAIFSVKAVFSFTNDIDKDDAAQAKNGVSKQKELLNLLVKANNSALNNDVYENIDKILDREFLK